MLPIRRKPQKLEYKRGSPVKDWNIHDSIRVFKPGGSAGSSAGVIRTSMRSIRNTTSQASSMPSHLSITQKKILTQTRHPDRRLRLPQNGRFVCWILGLHSVGRSVYVDGLSDGRLTVGLLTILTITAWRLDRCREFRFWRSVGAPATIAKPVVTQEYSRRELLLASIGTYLLWNNLLFHLFPLSTRFSLTFYRAYTYNIHSQIEHSFPTFFWCRFAKAVPPPKLDFAYPHSIMGALQLAIFMPITSWEL